MRVKVRDLSYVQRKIRVRGQRRRGIAVNPAFDFPRDAFDATQFDLSKLDAEIRRAVEETM